MFDLKTLKKAVDQIAEEKNIDAEKVFEALEESIAAAYKREYEHKGEIIKAKFDIKTGDVKFWQVKTVVDETTADVSKKEDIDDGGDDGTQGIKEKEEKKAEKIREDGDEDEEGVDKLPRYNKERHILLEEAKKIKSGVKLGDELTFPLEAHGDFGRIAAQTAKQVILQKLREAERESILGEYKDKEEEIVSGIIQRYERGNIYIDLGRAVGVMFFNESIPGEMYRSGDRMRFFVVAVQEDTKNPGIILSRAHPKFVSRLFAVEVPEINDGIVEIKSIAREAGSRTKLAVFSKVEGIDPVGSCVGQRGTRVMAVSNELGQEKLDIIEWSEDPATFIANSLSPAKIRLVEILPRREARVFVDDDQLSLAIGKGGQNVRLAHKLTGWKIDVRSQENPDRVQEGGIAGSENDKSEDKKVKEKEEANNKKSDVSNEDDLKNEVENNEKQDKKEKEN